MSNSDASNFNIHSAIADEMRRHLVYNKELTQIEKEKERLVHRLLGFYMPASGAVGGSLYSLFNFVATDVGDRAVPAIGGAIFGSLLSVSFTWVIGASVLSYREKRQIDAATARLSAGGFVQKDFTLG